MHLPRLTSPSAAMHKLDRMPWTAGLAIAAYGRKLGVRVNDPALLPALPGTFPFGWKPAPGPTVDRLYSLVTGRSHRLYEGAEPLVRSLHLPEILEALET